MLRELHISQLAVIEDVTIELDGGLNCFTGQTGAGKSLILGAFELLLGLRSGGADMLRPDADEARISGIFELHDPLIVAQAAELLDQRLECGDQLLIVRKIFASGRSSVSVNGQPATSPMVRAVGELLVDIHGQHDHQYLLKPSNQLLILDASGRCLDRREQFAADFARLGQLRQRQATLTASRTLRRQQLELYEFQAGEIDAADPQSGEFAQLRNRQNVLGNVKRIKADATAAHGTLYESEGSILERLAAVVHVLRELGDLDEEMETIAQQVSTATIALQEAAYDLGRYADRLDLDPAELGETEDRLNTLNRLISKYGDMNAAGEDPLDAVLRYRQQLEEQIRQLRSEDDDLGQLEGEIKRLVASLLEQGLALRELRQAAAQQLCPRVAEQLHELGMADASLEVAFEPLTLEEGEEAGGMPLGLDRVEFLVRTNPGQPARPLRKIASGGELSRIMLALKSILAASDRVSVLVFDEIDANIGGRMGTIIGQKLRDLVHGGAVGKTKPRKKSAAVTTLDPSSGRHQVLCITHLPQIAAYADRHLRIAKAVGESRGKRETGTTVTLLDGDARVEELAEMLAGKGVSATTRKAVQEMLVEAGKNR